MGDGPDGFGGAVVALVGFEDVDAVGHVKEGAIAAVTAAVAEFGGAWSIPDGGVGGVDGNWVGVFENDVGAGGEGGVVEVYTVEDEGDRVVGVQGPDLVVGELGGVEGVGPAVRFVGGVPEEEGWVGFDAFYLGGEKSVVHVVTTHIVDEVEADLIHAGEEIVEGGLGEGFERL